MDDIEIYTDDTRSEQRAVLHSLRQQMKRGRSERPNMAMADFVAPKESGVADYVGGFAVTAGHGEDEIAKRYAENLDDYKSILSKSLEIGRASCRERGSQY